MTKTEPTECTKVTVLFEGPRSQAAADAFVIQFADGGLDEDIEQRMQGQGFPVEETGFDTGSRTLTVTLG